MAEKLTDYQRWLLRQRLPKFGWGGCMDRTKKAEAALAVLLRKGVIERDETDLYRVTPSGRAVLENANGR